MPGRQLLAKPYCSFFKTTAMNFLFFHMPVENRKQEAYTRTVMADEEQQHNITEGGEFLDDAIRMKDQPLMYTEESVAAGSPEGLL